MRTIIVFLLFFSLSYTFYSQIIDANAFLKGNYVELAIGPCGVFASNVAAPAGYHPRTNTNPGFLGFVADPAMDGWNSGSPDYIGDFFMPGNPEEGWGMTIGFTNYNNNQICQQSDITGSITDYDSSSNEVSATWIGTLGGLTIQKRTYLPINSLYFMTDVSITNNTDSTINEIYYMRNVDPDHGQMTPGGGTTFNTLNSIVYQNPDPCNKAFVSAITNQGNYFLGLGSIDSRAHVTYGGFGNRSAREIYEGSMSLYSAGSQNDDIAISLGFNLGNLLPGESTNFKYTYVLSEADLNQALAATNISFNLSGNNLVTGSQTDICANTDIPIVIQNSGNFTDWNWSPATGLNTTTGDSVTITINTPITYTAVGTGSCGSVTLSIEINPVSLPIPGDAGQIFGNQILLPNDTSLFYSLDTVSFATTYLWNLPNGISIISGNSSDSILVNASNSPMCGTITVTPQNLCGNGAGSSIETCILNLVIDSIPNELCMEQTYILNYNTNTTLYPGNTFSVQLSDANGDFSDPLTLGTLIEIQSGSIPFLIPSGTPVGSNYSIRVISSSPSFTSTGVINQFSINSVTPTIDSLSNVLACDQYVLPNLSSGNYFSSSGGQGIAFNFGDTISSTQTIFIYSTNQQCSNENNFEVEINYTPLVDTFSNVSSCDNFILQPLTNGSYFSSINGNGNLLQNGDTIYNNQAVFVFAQQGICTNESSFEVTIVPTPTIDSINDVYSCELYTLPTLPIGGYFTNPGGNGFINAGDTIFSDQTIYLFAETGSCSAESSFNIFISNIPEVDNLPDVTFCGNYTLQNLNSGNYFSNPGGTGDMYIPGFSITETDTLYIFNQNVSCVNQSSFIVSIKPYPDNSVINSDPFLTAVQPGNSYQWVDCNNNYTSIDAATLQTFEASQNGTYAVVIMKDGCAILSDCFIINTASIENESEYNVKIYPNPTSGEIQLSFFLENLTFKITDISGKLIFTGVSSINQNTEIDFTNESTGIYFLEYSNKKYKIIKL